MPTKKTPFKPIFSTGFIFAAAVVIAFMVLSVLEWSRWRPGFSLGDEEATLGALQHWSEGAPKIIEIARASLSRLAAYALVRLAGPSLGLVHLPIVAGLALEFYLLFLLARRWFSAASAVGAVLVSALCAYTFLRARTIMGYALVPFELLLLLALAKSCLKPWKALLWGFAGALFWLDYEAWFLAWPILALAYLFEPKENRPPLPWALAGFGLGLGLVLILSWSALLPWWQVRQSQGLAWRTGGPLRFFWPNLKAFWLGGPAVPTFGLPGSPVFPVWAWPALVLGIAALWRRKPWILAWIVIGMLPLGLQAPALEPNRFLPAWPALCLAAGLGLATALDWLAKRFGPALAWLLVFVPPAVGVAVEARAYQNYVKEYDSQLYSASRDWMEAVKIVGDSGNKCRWLTELGSKDMAALRFLAAPVASLDPLAPPLFLIPPGYVQEPDPKMGRWISIQQDSGQVPCFFLYPSASWTPKLKAAEQVMKDLKAREYRGSWSERVADGLSLARDPGHDDPWVRTACLEYAAYWSIFAGQINPGLARVALTEQLLGPSFPAYLACHLRENPTLALALSERAVAINPRFRVAWQIRLQALRDLGRGTEAEKWSRYLASKPDDYTWDSCLCKDPLGGMP